jgi:coenzyme F420-reducing hydrogenase delta subunit
LSEEQRMKMKESGAISLETRLCSRCYICSSVCPYKAISLDPEGLPVIDARACLLCGLCASACPSGIIRLREYNPAFLSRALAAGKKNGESNLVLACRGSTAPDSRDELCEQDNHKGVFIRVPCVGRMPPAFYLHALSHGIEKILTVRCNSGFCRFKDGSLTSYSRIYALKRLISAMGYTDDTLTVVENAKQVDYTTCDCVGCDKCVQACPYAAISSGPLGSPSIDYAKCTGCGACTLVCAHLALEISGYEFRRMSEKVELIAGKPGTSGYSSPAILVFCCQWAEFSHLDRQYPGLTGPNVSIIEIPCFSKLDPVIILRALHQGFGGVLAITCSDDECKSKESRSGAADNMNTLNTALKMLGRETRFKVFRTSPRNPDDFEREIVSFSNTISLLKSEEVRRHE